MLPKNFFENFFQGEQDNKLFVCMPFDDSLDTVFEKIRSIATGGLGPEYNFKDAIRTKEEWAKGDLTEEIFNGIAHSKILLFDLSDDPKSPCQHSKEVNPNVVYELGVALTFRSAEDILLIRKKSERLIEKLPFDIKHLAIKEYENLEVELKDKLVKCLKKSEQYKARVISGISREVDDIGFFIIRNLAPIYDGKNFYQINGQEDIYDNFNIPEIFELIHQTRTTASSLPTIQEVRTSVLRLLDLGILWSAIGCKPSGFEYSYHWTELGKKVAKYIEERKSN